MQGGVPAHATQQRIVAAAAALEGVIRSCNNLLERLHHSYFMYLQPSTTHFITVEAYVVPPLLLIVALLLWAAHILVQPPVSEAEQALAGTRAEQPEGELHDFEEPNAGKASRRGLLRLLQWRRAPVTLVSGSLHPLLLSIDLAQFERCASAVLALHAACAAVGACVHGAGRGAAVSPADVALAGISSAGLAAMLARPWTRPDSWASRSKQHTAHGLRLSSSSVADAEQIDDWRAVKALGLIMTAALMAGALFVNWWVVPLAACCCDLVAFNSWCWSAKSCTAVRANHLRRTKRNQAMQRSADPVDPAFSYSSECRAVAHLSLLCLSVHLLLAQEAKKPTVGETLAAAPRWLAWTLIHPWGLAALATGKPAAELGGCFFGVVCPQVWLQWLRSSTPATQAFFWIVYLPAWLLPALLQIVPAAIAGLGGWRGRMNEAAC